MSQRTIIHTPPAIRVDIALRKGGREAGHLGGGAAAEVIFRQRDIRSQHGEDDSPYGKRLEMKISLGAGKFS